MTDRDLARQRLQNQRLTGAPLPSPEAVVGWLGAVQAQEFAVAKWSLGQRADDVREPAVDQALATGAILRTHILRPTWHFVRAADLPWLLALTGPRVQAGNAYWYRRFGLDDALVARSQAILAEAVAGGRHRTRAELAALLRAGGVAAEGLTLGYVLMRAELDRVLSSGAPRGPHHTYALFDERVPTVTPLERDEALAELAARYFASRGPATCDDFAWWSGLTLGDARRAVSALGSRLEQLTVGDRAYWSTESVATVRPDAPRAHLLQGYDEYIVAYRESRDVLDPGGAAGAAPPGTTAFTHAVVLDGHVVGHWRRAGRARTADVEVQLAAPPSPEGRAALDDAVARYGAFAGRPARWSRPLVTRGA